MPHLPLKKLFLALTLSLAILIGAAFFIFQSSPWPGALLIRYLFETNAAKTSAALERYVPNNVTSVLNYQYDKSDPDAYLDFYYPSDIQGSDDVRPTIVWVHGGAWLSGNKDEVANYLKILASYGYVVVGVNYTLAPKANHPTQTNQINKALEYLNTYATTLYMDNTKFILAGDSAGANLAAQEALVITNPDYAQQIGITPAIFPHNLIGVILVCGPYDIKLANYDGLMGLLLKEVLWSYSGTKSFLTDKNFETVSVLNFVNNNFPPTFITVGNADPLRVHSEKLADKLSQQEVLVDKLFFSANYPVSLGHEYQFNLDTAEGQEAISRINQFLRSIANNNSPK